MNKKNLGSFLIGLILGLTGIPLLCHMLYITIIAALICGRIYGF